MSVSQQKKESIKRYRLHSQKIKSSRKQVLTYDETSKLIEQFYKESEQYGFYRSIEDAKNKNGYYFIKPQREIAEAIIRSTFQKERKYIEVSISRQIGKTQVVVRTFSFIFKYFFLVFGESYSLCVIAPEKGTASEVFNRLVSYLSESKFEVDKTGYKRTVRGDVIELFGIYEGFNGSTIEGRTNNACIRDESHKGDDSKFKDEVLPTVFRNKGPVVMLGNGAYKKCFYGDSMKLGNTDDNIVFRYPYASLKPYMEKIASLGIKSARDWLDAVETYIKMMGGDESFEVRKNIHCEIMETYSAFITSENIENASVEVNGNIEGDIYMGIDFATSGDRTVATFISDKRVIFDWYIVKDANEQATLQDQAERLMAYCDSKGYLERIKAIGGDNTGLGIGGIEIFEAIFEKTIIPFTFTAKWKHNSYSLFRNLILSAYDENRIKINNMHPLYDMFKDEVSAMEVSVNKLGLYSIQAPQKQGQYDDMCASSVLSIMTLLSAQDAYDGSRYIDTKKTESRYKRIIMKRLLRGKSGNIYRSLMPSYC